MKMVNYGGLKTNEFKRNKLQKYIIQQKDK